MFKKNILSLLIMIIIISGVSAQNAAQDDSFSWRLAVIQNNKGHLIEDVIPMKNKESFYVEITPVDKDCYAYIVVQMESGATFAFPPMFIKAGTPSRTDTVKLSDTSGHEKFYVVTSLKEQESLKTSINNFNAAKKEKDNEKEKRTSETLMNRLFNIRDPNQADMGKPVDLASDIRGFLGFGSLFSGSSVYVRAFAVSH